MLATTDLTNPKVLTLDQAAAHGPHYRMRRRAQAVLGHSRGQSISCLAALFAVDADTVSRWLRRWRAQGVSGLREGPLSPATLPGCGRQKNQPLIWATWCRSRWAGTAPCPYQP